MAEYENDNIRIGDLLLCNRLRNEDLDFCRKAPFLVLYISDNKYYGVKLNNLNQFNNKLKQIVFDAIKYGLRNNSTFGKNKIYYCLKEDVISRLSIIEQDKISDVNKVLYLKNQYKKIPMVDEILANSEIKINRGDIVKRNNRFNNRFYLIIKKEDNKLLSYPFFYFNGSKKFCFNMNDFYCYINYNYPIFIDANENLKLIQIVSEELLTEVEFRKYNNNKNDFYQLQEKRNAIKPGMIISSDNIYNIFCENTNVDSIIVLTIDENKIIGIDANCGCIDDIYYIDLNSKLKFMGFSDERKTIVLSNLFYQYLDENYFNNENYFTGYQKRK